MTWNEEKMKLFFFCVRHFHRVSFHLIVWRQKVNYDSIFVCMRRLSHSLSLLPLACWILYFFIYHIIYFPSCVSRLPNNGCALKIFALVSRSKPASSRFFCVRQSSAWLTFELIFGRVCIILGAGERERESERAREMRKSFLIKIAIW